MSTSSTLVAATLRAEIRTILVWTVSICGLIALMPSAYAYFLNEPSTNDLLAQTIGGSSAIGILYGPLPEPATVGQMVQWEIGAFALVATALMAVSIAGRGRTSEDSGLRELVQAVGIPRAGVFGSQIIAPVTASAAVALTTALVIAAQVPFVDGLTVSGAVLFGLALGLNALAYTGLTLIFGQLARDSRSARTFGYISVAVGYAVRVGADGADAPTLRWLTPFGWKDILSPFTHNAWQAGIPMLIACFALLLVAWLLFDSRELHGGMLPAFDSSTARLRANNYFVFEARMELWRLVSWLVVVTALGTLFGRLAGSLMDLLQSGGFDELMEQMTGLTNPGAQYIAVCADFLGILVMFAAIQITIALAGSERHGYLDNLLAVGLSRATILMSCLLWMIAASLLLAAAGGAALMAASQPYFGFDQAVYALWGTLSALPGAVAAGAVTLLLFAINRRYSAGAWIPAVWSTVVAWFGGLLRFPEWLTKLTFIGWRVDPQGSSDWAAIAVLVAVACAASVLALIVFRRRDVGLQ